MFSTHGVSGASRSKETKDSNWREIPRASGLKLLQDLKDRKTRHQGIFRKMTPEKFKDS